ncbi:MAG: hypothetical protein ACYTBJ_02335 [Planctomycetota bacterium]
MRAPTDKSISNGLSTSTGEMTLTAGNWAIWSDQAFKMQINRATGTSLGSGPQVWPANFVWYWPVGHGSTNYLQHARNSVSGTIYANYIGDPTTS